MAMETLRSHECRLGQHTTETPRLALPALVLASAAAQLTLVIANPILLNIAQSFHLPLPLVAQGRTLQSAGSAAMALGATLIADRVPRRGQLLIGLAGIALTGVALSLIDAFPLWLLVQVISGAASGVVALACATAVGDYFADTRRGTAMGWVVAGMGFAWLLGLPVVGFVAGAWGWRAAYAVLGGGTALAALVAIAAAVPPLLRPTAETTPLLAGWRQLLCQQAARGLLLGDALTGTAWAGFLIYLGPFFGMVYAMRSSAIGTMLSLASLIGISGILSAAFLAHRVGTRRLLLASSVLGAVAITIPLSAKLTPIFSLAVLAPYILLSCVRFPTSRTIALSLLPTARGTMMAARGFTVAAAGMMGSLTCALLFALGGFGTIGMGCALLTIAGAYAYARSLAEGSLPAASPAPATAAD